VAVTAPVAAYSIVGNLLVDTLDLRERTAALCSSVIMGWASSRRPSIDLRLKH